MHCIISEWTWATDIGTRAPYGMSQPTEQHATRCTLPANGRCYGSKEEPLGIKGRYAGVLTLHTYKARICREHPEEKAKRRQPDNRSAKAARTARGVTPPRKLAMPVSTQAPTGVKGTALQEATLLRLTAAKTSLLKREDWLKTADVPIEMVQLPICIPLARRVANAGWTNTWTAEHHCSTAPAEPATSTAERTTLACFPCCAFRHLEERHGLQTAKTWTDTVAKEVADTLHQVQLPTRTRLNTGLPIATGGEVLIIQRPHPLAMMWAGELQPTMNAYSEFAWDPTQHIYNLTQRHSVTLDEKARKCQFNPNQPDAKAFMVHMQQLRALAAVTTIHLASPVTMNKPCDVDVIIRLISPETTQDMLPLYLRKIATTPEAEEGEVQEPAEPAEPAAVAVPNPTVFQRVIRGAKVTHAVNSVAAAGEKRTAGQGPGTLECDRAVPGRYDAIQPSENAQEEGDNELAAAEVDAMLTEGASADIVDLANAPADALGGSSEPPSDTQVAQDGGEHATNQHRPGHEAPKK